MKSTYFEIMKNDVRVCEINTRKQDGTTFTPDSASAAVWDENMTETVVAEQEAYIDSNKVYIAIGRTVSSTVGKYKVRWRIASDTNIYNHITILAVEDY